MKDRILTINLDKNTVCHNNLTLNEQYKAFEILDELLHDETREVLIKKIDKLDMQLYNAERDISEQECIVEYLQEKTLRM